MSINKALKLIREPRAINAAQIIQYAIAAGAGLMAALGVASPQFMTATIGPVVITAVGSTLILGGVLWAVAVIAGMWWLERIALVVVFVGFLLLLPPAVFYAISGRSPAIWIVMALVVWALCDVFKRYRRIDWAYLDPAK